MSVVIAPGWDILRGYQKHEVLTEIGPPDRGTEINRWLTDPDNLGLTGFVYDRYDRNHNKFRYIFSDENTAFMFKMRWG